MDKEFLVEKNEQLKMASETLWNINDSLNNAGYFAVAEELNGAFFSIARARKKLSHIFGEIDFGIKAP